MACQIENKLRSVKYAVDHLTEFLNLHKTLIDAHTTNFLVDKQWNSIVPIQIGQELLRLSDDELAQLPNGKLYEDTEYQESLLDEKIFIRRVAEITVHDGNTSKQNDSLHGDENCFTSSTTDFVDKNLRSFIKSTQSHTLAHFSNHSGCMMESHSRSNCPIVSSIDELAHFLELPDKSEGVSIGNFMSTKKSYEVNVLTDLCARLAKGYKITKVIDLGSGLGYLGAHLALMHGLQVLGIDSANERTHAAEIRTRMLRKQWRALVENATKVCDGSQSEKQKAKNKRKNNSSAKTSATISCINVSRELQILDDVSHLSLNMCLYKPVTKYITSNTNLLELFHSNFGLQSEDVVGDSDFTVDVNDANELLVDLGSAVVDQIASGSGQLLDHHVLLSGLHTCGDLGSSILRIFSTNSDAKILCTVGCCYNLLTDDEASKQNKFTEDRNDRVCGFPMSSSLKNCKFSVSRNAKLLAAQAADRLTMANQLPPVSIYWRAMLQVILTDHVSVTANSCPSSTKDNLGKNWHVGKLASKSRTFQEYVRKAFLKLGLTNTLTDDEIESYQTKFASDEKKIRAFHQLRVSLASSIEALILLDRLAFLLEQKSIEDAFLVQVFDSIKSPRCYALVAVKSHE